MQQEIIRHRLLGLPGQPLTDLVLRAVPILKFTEENSWMEPRFDLSLEVLTETMDGQHTLLG